MNLSKIAPLPENNYLSVSEYAAIVGIAISTGEENLLESTATKICLFRSIATLTTFNHTNYEITAYPVTILAALFDIYLQLAADRLPATDNAQN